jgi:hypothetical protein
MKHPSGVDIDHAVSLIDLQFLKFDNGMTPAWLITTSMRRYVSNAKPVKA